MRQLFPVARDPVDPLDVYGDLPPYRGRPGVRLNMIASLDGATSMGGVSRGLSGDADRALFLALRSLTDVVLVGAGTVRAEHYRPSRVPVAIVTRSCKLDWEAPFFIAPIARPIVITSSDAPAEARARAAELADVVVAGAQDVDLARALDALAERGHRSVLAEGGPNLNGQLAREDLLDELCLTLSPKLVGGDEKRVLAGPALPTPHDLALRSVCEQDGFLFLRFR